MKTHRSGSPGFTLVELLVSMVVLSLLLLILLGIVNQTSDTWRYTVSKVEQFRGARDGFESMTRRLSQATLNTYWDYDPPPPAAPQKYIRQSDLRFLAGGAALVTEELVKPRPTHAVFFQAPLGFVDELEFIGLENLINTWGYFVEFNSDLTSRPRFLEDLDPKLKERHRFRLMEMMQPSNKLNIYSLTSGLSGDIKTQKKTWITAPLTSAQPPIHVLAENIIALVILPKLAAKEDPSGIKLASDYNYDSTDLTKEGDPEVNPRNQLPPLVQVTLVAIDEASAVRIADGQVPPDWGLDGLFKNAANYQEDLGRLTAALSQQRLAYRVFTTHVSIQGAKWSRK